MNVFNLKLFKVRMLVILTFFILFIQNVYGIYGEDEFQINTSGGGRQSSLTVLRDGNFVVVWSYERTDSEYEVYAQMFDSFGSKLGEEFRVNTEINDSSSIYPVVSSLNNGNFVIVWDSNNRHGDMYVRFQKFDAFGNKIGSEDRMDQAGTKYPCVATLNSGRFVVVALDRINLPGIDFKQIIGSAYSSYGEVASFRLTSTSSRGVTSFSHDLAALENGNFVLVWRLGGIYGEVLDGSGSIIRDEFHVNNYTSGSDPKVSSLNDDFVVVWSDNSQDSDGPSIYAQLFDEDASKIGDEIKVTSSCDACKKPAVSSLDYNNFVVTWQNDAQNYTGIYGQFFSSVSGKIGNEFEISRNDSCTYDNDNVASLSDSNRFVVVWDRDCNDGSGWNIFGEIFSLDFYVTNSYQQLDYVEDTPKKLDRMEIVSPNSDVEVNMIFSDIDAGSLNCMTTEDATSTYDPETGQWIGSGTIDGVNALLDGLIFTPLLNYVKDFSISIHFDDGGGFPLDGKIDFTAFPINDPPVIVVTEVPLVYECEEVFVDDAIEIVDIDNRYLQGARVYMGGDVVVVSDFLGFKEEGIITSSYNYDSGELTLTGRAMIEEYQNALRNVEYRHNGEFLAGNTITISFVVNDGESDSNVATRDIIVDAISSACGDYDDNDDEDEPDDEDDSDDEYSSTVMPTWVWGTISGAVIGSAVVAVSAFCCFASVLVIKKIKTNTKYYKKVPNLPDDISSGEGGSSIGEEEIEMQDVKE